MSDSITPDAEVLTIDQIRDRRDALRDPFLRSDADTLVSILLDPEGPSYAGFSRALEVRKELAADTQAPTWLRHLASDVVESQRNR